MKVVITLGEQSYSIIIYNIPTVGSNAKLLNVLFLVYDDIAQDNCRKTAIRASV